MIWRAACRADIPVIIALLRDDALGAGRETDDLPLYQAAFDAMAREGANHLIVGERDGVVMATYQITLISGLSLKAARRAQIESVRVSSELRGQGIGALLMADAEQRARAAGCTLMQLTTNATRTRAHGFYTTHGFTPSHIGFKRDLT
jgi:GNAT superfamily N-acetyltransferase